MEPVFDFKYFRAGLCLAVYVIASARRLHSAVCSALECSRSSDGSATISVPDVMIKFFQQHE